jgi:hypothetical protein
MEVMTASTTLVGPVVAARSIIYLGMDVHKESITIAMIPRRRDGTDAAQLGAGCESPPLLRPLELRRAA